MSSPIIVIDSGLGGLTVVKALRETLPLENIVYFGDTARLPYGSKTSGTVTSFVRQIIAYLRPHHPRHVIIACNTATALALPEIKKAFPDLSITGVIEPGAKAAVVAAGTRQIPTIGILATEATVRSKAYEHAIHRRRHHARLIVQAAPLLVPIIEEGRSTKDPLVKLAIQQYLHGLMRHRVEVLVLGCTHYPIYKEMIQQTLGRAVTVIDSAQQCAEDVARRLRSSGLISGRAKSMEPGTQGSFRSYVTDDPSRFRLLAPRFLGVEIDEPTWVAPEELYENQAVPSVRLSLPA